MNLIGIGDDPNNLKLRGPGCLGTSTVMSIVKRFFIWLNEHSTRVLVEKCDYISAVGWGEGGKQGRNKLGLLGEGPKFVFTPKAILDFDEETKKMRLKHLLPGNTIENVVKSTGFKLLIPDTIEDMIKPTEEEIETLRKRVDPYSSLRK